MERRVLVSKWLSVNILPGLFDETLQVANNTESICFHKSMAERASIRGGRGRGGSSRGGENRGGRGGGHGGDQGAQQAERPKKENILDLSKYADKRIFVKFNGGREVEGTLKGYDQLMNLVLDDVQETVSGKSSYKFYTLPFSNFF